MKPIMQPSIDMGEKRKGSFYFLLAFSLLNVLAFTLALCCLGFFLGWPISGWSFPLAVLLTLLVHGYTARSFPGVSLWKSAGLFLILITGLILIAGFFYDTSYDGQWYHQETVIRLKEGFNPVYQQLSAPPAEQVNYGGFGWCNGPDADIPRVPDTSHINASVMKWMNITHFSKGSEIIGAAIFRFTGKIETGKAMNGFLLAAGFFLCLSLFYRIGRIREPRKWLLAALCAANPVAIMQWNTFCVDGNVACTLLCLVALCFLLLEPDRPSLFLLGSLLVIAVNIKFTNIIYSAVLCVGFLGLLQLLGKAAFRKVLGVCVLSSAIGIAFCGYNPYMTNLVRNRDPFYGLRETREVINFMTPPILAPLNRFQKFFYSVSAHQGWKSADRRTLAEIPKIPFTFNKADLMAAKETQQEFSAFGPFFSGALLVALVLLAFALVRFWKTPVVHLCLVFFILLGVSIFINPDPWWGRFIPQLWLLPLLIGVMSEFLSFRGSRVVRSIVYLSIGLNAIWASLCILSNIDIAVRSNYQMRQLQALHQTIDVEYCPNSPFTTNRERFKEWGIPTVNKEVEGVNVYHVIESNTRFSAPAPLPDLPQSMVMRWLNKASVYKQ